MKKVSLMLVSSFVVFASVAFAQEVISAGTVIPIELKSSLSLETKPGQLLTARVMQDVPLSTGTTIRAGAEVMGHVLSVPSPGAGQVAQISLAFDQLVFSKRTIPLNTELRAIASFVEVEQAQIPETGPARGTPENAWTAVQVGGDVVYRGGGPVTEGSRVVGKPTSQGVVSQVVSKTGTNSRGAIDGNDGPQALWVFSSDACGVYGFPGVGIAHAGRSSPIGEITLTTQHSYLKVQGGTGILLRVTGTNRNGAMNKVELE